MIGAERRTLIVEELRESGSVRVTTLAERFGVDPVTIRRDLNRLEEAGHLRRVHGGAVLRKIHQDVKPVSALARRIGEAAARALPAESVVFIAPGTFTPEIIPFLGEDKPTTVITNALDVAWNAAHLPHHTLHVIGGQVDEEYRIYGGLETQPTLRADWIILEAGGLDAQRGLSHDQLRYANMARALVNLGTQVMVLAAAEHVGRAGAVFIAPATAVDMLVTGREAPNAPLWDLSETGMRVVLT
jgi:DeoR/GlpR family transcriptional regulator of sugar metabolism